MDSCAKLQDPLTQWDRSGYNMALATIIVTILILNRYLDNLSLLTKLCSRSRSRSCQGLSYSKPLLKFTSPEVKVMRCYERKLSLLKPVETNQILFSGPVQQKSGDCQLKSLNKLRIRSPTQRRIIKYLILR